MAQFDESKHPRDGCGKFTDKNGNNSYRQNTDYKEIVKNDNQKRKKLKNRFNSDFTDNKTKKHTKTKHLTSKIMYLYSSNREVLEKNGSIIKQVFSADYMYTVEIIGFAGEYKILSRRKIK